MDLRLVAYFVAAAEARSLSGAARRLHVSQATVSQQLRRLERQTGTPLFLRHPRGVMLTDAGRALLDPARQMLRAKQSFLDTAAVFARGFTAELHLGVLHHGAAELTSPILRAFRREYPAVEVVPHAVSLADLEAGLLAGRVDVALQYLPIHDPQLRADPLFDEPRAIVVSRDHPFAADRRVSTARYLRSATVTATSRAPSRWAAFWGLNNERDSLPRTPREFDSVAAALLYISTSGDVATSMPLSAGRFLPYADLRFVTFAENLSCTAAMVSRTADDRPMISDFRAIAVRVATERRALVPHATAPSSGDH